jgi:hypothetical protein
MSQGPITVTANYTCSICTASYACTIPDLDSAEQFISQRSKDILNNSHKQLVKLGHPGSDPIGELTAKMRQDAVDRLLLFATCPKCEAENPKGTEISRIRVRNERVISTTVCLSLALLSWLVPAMRYVVVALVVPLFLFIAVMQFRLKQSPASRILRTIRNVGELGLISYLTFSYSWMVAIYLVFMAGRFFLQPNAEPRWAATSKKLRFETSPYR